MKRNGLTSSRMPMTLKNSSGRGPLHGKGYFYFLRTLQTPGCDCLLCIPQDLVWQDTQWKHRNSWEQREKRGAEGMPHIYRVPPKHQEIYLHYFIYQFSQVLCNHPIRKRRKGSFLRVKSSQAKPVYICFHRGIRGTNHGFSVLMMVLNSVT